MKKKNKLFEEYSFARLWSIIAKEFIQMQRDIPTILMMVALPLMQIILFGYAINTNPKHLPTALVSADHSVFTRTLMKGIENTGYFRLLKPVKTRSEADQLMKQGKINFIISIPPNFTRQLVRGEKPEILTEIDATDPVSSPNAIAALSTVLNTAFNENLHGPLANLRYKPGPVALNTHLKYNPLIITQYYIVPGLLGVILTMTMVFITALAMTRERERGTMENLLATPVKPIEVMIGKITPYIIMGYVQVFLILLASRYLFDVPVQGNIFLLLIATLPFIAANLAMGLTFSTIAKNQLQAIQGAMFFFLPSILLSGFMFPFAGMPQWAQWIGEALPLTHFVIITRGILLKGSGLHDLWPQIWPILLFTFVVISVGLKRFRQTLD